MSIFFSRNETASHVTITISPWWLYICLGLLAIIMVPRIGQEAEAPAGIVSMLALGALIIVSLWRLVQMRGVRGEIFRAMKEGSVQMSGSRFNPTSPMVIKIEKKHADPAEQKDAD